MPGLPAAIAGPLREFVRRPNYTRFEVLAMRIIEHISPKRELPSITDHIPGGFFDNRSLERWLRRSLQRIKIPNDFRAFSRKTGKRLYVGPLARLVDVPVGRVAAGGTRRFAVAFANGSAVSLRWTAAAL